MKIFSGTSNLPLAKKIAQNLGVSLAKAEITRFPDGECRVWVKEDVRGLNTFVVQSLSRVADENLVELSLLGWALKNLGAKTVTAVIPWLGYSKQDKEFRSGEAISIQLVAKFIETAGFDKVITCELHSLRIKDFFKIPLIILSTKEVLAKAISFNKNMAVVSPDEGGKNRSQDFAKEFNLPILYIKKKRDLKSGKVRVLKAPEVFGKEVVIFDDIINTGATIVEEAKALKKAGSASIIVLATHPVFSGESSIILDKSLVDQVIVSDTIAIPKEKFFPKLKIVSVSGILAESLWNDKL